MESMDLQGKKPRRETNVVASAHLRVLPSVAVAVPVLSWAVNFEGEASLFAARAVFRGSSRRGAEDSRTSHKLEGHTIKIRIDFVQGGITDGNRLEEHLQ